MRLIKFLLFLSLVSSQIACEKDNGTPSADGGKTLVNSILKSGENQYLLNFSYLNPVNRNTVKVVLQKQIDDACFEFREQISLSSDSSKAGLIVDEDDDLKTYYLNFSKMEWDVKAPCLTATDSIVVTPKMIRESIALQRGKARPGNRISIKGNLPLDASKELIFINHGAFDLVKQEIVESEISPIVNLQKNTISGIRFSLDKTSKEVVSPNLKLAEYSLEDSSWPVYNFAEKEDVQKYQKSRNILYCLMIKFDFTEYDGDMDSESYFWASINALETKEFAVVKRMNGAQKCLEKY